MLKDPLVVNVVQRRKIYLESIFVCEKINQHLSKKLGPTVEFNSAKCETFQLKHIS